MKSSQLAVLASLLASGWFRPMPLQEPKKPDPEKQDAAQAKRDRKNAKRAKQHESK